jgi:hypothetical protein
MLKKTLPVLGILMCLPFLSFSTKVSTVKVKFYSATVDVQYDQGTIFKFRTCTRDKCLRTFFQTMEGTNYQVLLDDLLNYKEILKLNDWFFYKLVRKSVEKIYAKETEIYQTLVCWFLFTKAGYDTHLNTAVNQFVFLNVVTKDKVYNTPFSRYEGKIYVNLTALYYKLNTRRALYEIPAYKATEGGKIFSFDIDHLPNIPSKVIKKTVQFKYDKQPYSVEIEVDTMARALMRGYPTINDENYFKVAPSDNLKSTLLPQLESFLEGKTEQEKVEFLVSFTRSGFKYKFDEDLYRRNKPMIPEEIFLSEFSDHEDRCALFYFLMTEFTNLDVIPIRYYEVYLTMAVELPNPVGKPIDYNGKSYFVCDPTSPNNSKSIGKFPRGMTYESMKIVGGF